MTIGSDLATALAPTAKLLVTQFGQLVELRRQVKDDAPDGTTLIEWRKVGGVEMPFPIYATMTTARQRETLWGKERKADVSAVVLLLHTIAEGDVVRFNQGSFTGRCFEVEALIPYDTGGIAEAALKEVPDRNDYGF